MDRLTKRSQRVIFRIFLVLILSGSLHQAIAQHIMVRGRVHQKDINLIGASIILEGTTLGVSANEQGNFTFLLEPGIYSIAVSFTGYLTKTITFVVQKPEYLDIELEEDSKILEELVVSSEASDYNVQSVEIGVSKLNMKTLSKLPSFMGEVDIIKSLLTLPGVTTVGEGTSDINVRGGSADQNLILMDDAPIFNSSHLMGLFSIFNPDMVENLEFYRGGIPPKFGERVSSVLNISLRNPNSENWHVRGGLGLIASRLSVDGPIIPGKLSVMVGGRVSFPDYLFQLSGNPALENTTANFYDLTGKIEYTPNSKNKIFFTGYNSFDRFKVASDSLAVLEINASSSEYDWETLNGTLGWRHDYSDRLYSRIVGVWSNYSSAITSEDELIAFDLQSSILYKGVKADFVWKLGDKHTMDFGGSGISYTINPGALKPGSDVSNINAIDLPQEQSREGGLYVSDEVTLSPKVSLLIGTRYSMFFAEAPATKYLYLDGEPKNLDSIYDTLFNEGGEQYYGGIEPRMSLRVNLNSVSSIKLGYNRMRQYIQRITNTTSALPTDRWQTSNAYIKPQIADQVSLGYYRNFKENMFETSLETFFKHTANATDYKDGANLLLHPATESAILQGTGRAYGVEVQAKKNKGKLTGWVNYTYSQSHIKMESEFEEEQINQGNWYPTYYNKPHAVNLIVNYKQSKRFSYSANFTYSTGRPITYPEGKYFVGDVYVPDFVNRNNGTIPDYHRLDVSMTYDPKTKKERKWKSNWSFSIYNLYARKNAYSVFFKPNNQNVFQYSKSVNTYKLSIFGTVFPSITYNFEF